MREILFLARDLSSARVEIRAAHEFVLFRHHDRGVLREGDEDVPFRVITEEDQLRGLIGLRYERLPSFDQLVEPNKQKRMIEIAMTRIR